MATRKPLVRIGGKNQQLPAADTIDVPGARFHEGDTEPTIKSYGDRWLHGSMAIEYTWVDPGVWVDLSEPTAADVAAAIHAATGKTTPVDADELGLSDSEASWSLKKLTWANLKAAVADLPSLAAKVSKTGDTMTGPLSVPAGASGAQVPQVQQIPSLVRAMAVGTVSQSGGVPTGAIIEQGSNANGRYVRFADGTQFIYRTADSISGGGVGVLFPAAFSAVPIISLCAGIGASGVFGTFDALDTSGFSLHGWVHDGTRAAISFQVIAFGRWF